MGVDDGRGVCGDQTTIVGQVCTRYSSTPPERASRSDSRHTVTALAN
jgi:hypothetical protein